jgi:hypothetical protein
MKKGDIPLSLDKRREARQVPVMNFERYAGLASVVGIVLIWTFIVWTGATTHEQWLGFIGSLIGAGVTLLAAWFAWRAVQRQIGVQQEIASIQTAIQRFSILQAQFEGLQTDRRLVMDLKLQARLILTPQRMLKEPENNIFGVRLALAQYLKCEKKLEAIEAELDMAASNKWVLPSSAEHLQIIRSRRNDVEEVLGLARIDLEFVSKRFDANDEDSPLTAEDTAVCNAIDLTAASQALASACDRFIVAIRPGVERIQNLIDRARKDAGV